ncbi:hypothetical protein V8C86DRAFT_2684505 [Haematococcus lacustris]
MIASASLTRGSTAALLLLTLLGAACELGAESGLLRPLNSVGGRQLQQASDEPKSSLHTATGTCSKPAIVQSLPANSYVMLGKTASTCDQKPSWKGLAGADITYLLRAEDHDRSIRFSTCRAHTGDFRKNNLHVFKAQPGICSLEVAALKAVTVASAIGRDSCAGPTFIAKAGQEYLVVSEAVTQPNTVILGAPPCGNPYINIDVGVPIGTKPPATGTCGDPLRLVGLKAGDVRWVGIDQRGPCEDSCCLAAYLPKTDFTFLLRGDDKAVRTVGLLACKFTDPGGVTPKLTIYKAGPAACGKDEAAKAALKQTGSLEGNNCENRYWGVRTTFTAQPGQDYLVVWGGMGRERQCGDSEVRVAIS